MSVMNLELETGRTRLAIPQYIMFGYPEQANYYQDQRIAGYRPLQGVCESSTTREASLLAVCRINLWELMFVTDKRHFLP